MEEEVPGCICQTSIYVYSMPHNIICNIKEEKIEVKILCKMKKNENEIWNYTFFKSGKIKEQAIELIFQKSLNF